MDNAADWEGIRELAETAEAEGLDSLWLADHFLYQPPDGGDCAEEGPALV